MTVPQEVQTFIDTVGKKFGKVEIKPKSSSWLMKAIGWLFSVTRISPEFMTRYITTIGNTVYYPDDMLNNPDSESMLRVVVHETVHVADSKTFTGPLFNFLYLFPQSLALLSLLSLLAVFKLGFLWCLLFLLCLAPIPAPFRYWFELRAYRTSILFARKNDKLTDEQMIPIYEWIESQLCTNLYYWTWPFPKTVRKHLINEDWMNEGIFRFIYNWIVIRRVLRNYSIDKGVEHNQEKE